MQTNKPPTHDPDRDPCADRASPYALRLLRQTGRARNDAVAGLAHEVIQRLSRGELGAGSVSNAPSTEEVRVFCCALLSNEDATAAEIIADARAGGVSAERICVGYLEAAARMLGRWWVEDRVGFAEVTIASSRILTILRELRCTFEKRPSSPEAPLIFASLPGEHHVLGVSMAAELFRQDGWSVLLEVGLSHDEIVALVERSPGSIVGLSLGGWHSLDSLSRLVGALRVVCPANPIVVSGQAVADLEPHLALLGVDGIAPDIEKAKDVVSVLWDVAHAGGERASAPVARKGGSVGSAGYQRRTG